MEENLNSDSVHGLLIKRLLMMQGIIFLHDIMSVYLLVHAADSSEQSSSSPQKIVVVRQL